MTIRRKASLIFMMFLLLLAGFFYARTQVYFSHGNPDAQGVFEITKGEGNAEIASDLQKEGFISGKVYFWIYLKTHNMLNNIYPGQYLLNGNLTIPEIASIITNPEKMFVSVTFPEGWTAQQMADRLSAKGFDGNAFLDLVKNPSQEIISQYPVLNSKPKGASLEGYLFPDTYSFSKEATPEGILKKILNNTQIKITPDILSQIKTQKKSLFDILTMASIVEGEVRTDTDRKIVAGIFYNRLANNMALGSDATLEYVLGGNKRQHSIAETQTDSPYNTYRYKGLPPGPVSNPGIAAINASIEPAKTDYNYFLTDPATGNTVFAKTFAEHVANKTKYGL